MRNLLLLLAGAVLVWADGGTIDGTVLSDANGEPLRRAQVVLRPMETGRQPVGTDADDHGHFSFTDVKSGKYAFLVMRDGYLPTADARHGAFRMPRVFSYDSNQALKNVTFRLRPWCVVGGKVDFEDGEPAVGVLVQVYQEFHYRGRHGYQVVGSARADDHGEYRVPGLPSGSFVVAAIYDKGAPVVGMVEQERRDVLGNRIPPEGYSTTFYPRGLQLSDAAPVDLTYGREVGAIDIFLLRTKKIRIRGRALDGISGEPTQAVSLTLEHLDERNVAALPISSVHFTLDRQGGGFTATGVPPGHYMLVAMSGHENQPLSARVPITVGESDIDNLEVTLRPETNLTGRVDLPDRGNLRLGQIRIAFEPRGDKGRSVYAQVNEMGTFKATLAAGEVYDIDIQNLPDDLYLKAVRSGTADVLASGVTGNLTGGSNSLTVELGMNGAQVVGHVLNEQGTLASGASLLLVPDPSLGRLHAFRQGFADENGQYILHGVPPGSYYLVAWVDEPPCDVYDPRVAVCVQKGISLRVDAGTQYAVDVRLLPDR